MAKDSDPNDQVRIKENVRVAISNPKGKILILQKDETSKTPFKWELPGGKVENVDLKAQTGLEVQLKALKIKVSEETGMDISDLPIKPLGIFAYVYDFDQDKFPVTVHAFSIELDEERSKNPIRLNPSKNHMAHRWASQDELGQMLDRGVISPNSSGAISSILGRG